MTNPEAQAVPQSEYSHDSERSILDINFLEAWRHSEEARRNAALGYQDGDPFDLKKEFDTSIDTSLDNYLSQHGLTSESDEYDEVHSLYRSASIDKISDTEWYTSPSSRGELFYDRDADVPAREVFAQQISNMKSGKSDPKANEKLNAAHEEALDMNAQFDAAQAAATPNHGEDVENAHTEALLLNERFDALQTELPDARKKLAKLASRRQGRLFGKGGEDYVLAKQDYDAKVQEFGRIKFSDETQYLEQMDDAQREQLNAKIIAYVLDEQKELRDQTSANLKGTKVGKFVEFMNRGSKKVRIAKAIGLGVITGATGAFLLAPLAAGTAVAGVAAAGSAYASRFARGYAVHDKRGMGDIAQEHQSAIETGVKDSDSSLFDQAREQADATFENDTKHEQHKRKKAVAWGVGSIAVGSVAGYALHAGMEHVTSHDLSLFGGKHFGAQTSGSAHGTIDHDAFKGGGHPTPGVHPSPERYLPGQGTHHIPEMTHGSGHVGDGIHGGHNTSDYFSGHNGTTEFSTGGAHNFESWMNGAKGAGYTVKPGDTIWGLSQKYLESQGVKHPSIYQTDAVKDQMLKAFQAKGLADHRGWLTAGAKVKF